MIAAVVAFLRALAAYWQLRAVRYRHDLIEQSRNQIKKLEDEIEKQRDIGTVASTDLADRMRDRLRRERGYLKYLSNAGLKAGGGNESAD